MWCDKAKLVVSFTSLNFRFVAMQPESFVLLKKKKCKNRTYVCEDKDNFAVLKK